MPVYRLVLPREAEWFSVEPGRLFRGASPEEPADREAGGQYEQRTVLPPRDVPVAPPSVLPPSGLELAPLPAHLIPASRAPAAPAGGQATPSEKPKLSPSTTYVEPLEVPTPERLFRLESERELYDRIRQEQRDQGARATFPGDVAVAPPGVTYQGRAWPRFVNTIPTSVSAYQPLYFEDKNVERYGWDAGIFQPLLSAGKFYLDLALLPYNLGAQPPWSLEYNAGYALPGDPEPYRLYLPRLSLTGAGLESLAVLGIIALP
ncbi:hypothetical protein HRbin36_01669 [bacterium HR36]|nr:hypothetical protein HRbin36_01669 [bacterium HR36]